MILIGSKIFVKNEKKKSSMQNQFSTVLICALSNIGFVFPQDLNLSDPCNLSLVVLSLGCRSNPSIILQKNSNLFVQSISFDRYLNLSILCIMISSHQAGGQVCLLKGKRSPSAGLVLFHQAGQMFSFSQTSIQVIPVPTYRIS